MEGNSKLPLMKEDLELLQGVVSSRGKLIFAMVAGSAGYNLGIATSDKDLFGVYLADEKGPFCPAPTSFDHTDPDYAIYEVNKYAELLIKGNPKVIEPLFTKHLAWCSEEWEAIAAIRHLAINKQTILQYKSFGKQQLRAAMEDHERVSKKFYHSKRLYLEALAMLEGKEPRVYWEGAEREDIMKIREGRVDIDECIQYLTDLETRVEALYEKSELKSEMTREDVSAWTVPLKIQQLQALALRKWEDTAFTPCNELNDRLRLRAEEILKSHGIAGTILFCCPYGATARGESTHLEDYFAVYALSTNVAYQPVKTDQFNVFLCATSPSSAQDKFRRGYQLIEVGHFMDALVKGYHLFVEALFMPTELCWTTKKFKEEFLDIIPDKRIFISKQNYLSYLGMIEGLLKSKSADAAKRLKLACQFLSQVESLLADKDPTPHALCETIITKEGVPLLTEEEITFRAKRHRDAVMEKYKQSKHYVADKENVAACQKLANDFLLLLRNALVDRRADGGS